MFGGPVFHFAFICLIALHLFVYHVRYVPLCIANASHCMPASSTPNRSRKHFSQNICRKAPHLPDLHICLPGAIVISMG